MEADEVAEFSKKMREAGEDSLTHVSLIISVLAVLVAMVTVLGHREHTEAVLSQAQASDQWNEYQARRIRQAEVGLTADVLRALPQTGQGSDEQTRKLKEYSDRLANFQAQLDEDSRGAREKEAEVTKAEHRAARLDLGEALLQIAVVLASITLLTRRSFYVLIALALGVAGLLSAASALIH